MRKDFCVIKTAIKVLIKINYLDQITYVRLSQKGSKIKTEGGYVGSFVSCCRPFDLTEKLRGGEMSNAG